MVIIINVTYFDAILKNARECGSTEDFVRSHDRR